MLICVIQTLNLLDSGQSGFEKQRREKICLLCLIPQFCHDEFGENQQECHHVINMIYS